LHDLPGVVLIIYLPAVKAFCAKKPFQLVGVEEATQLTDSNGK
jgi:hypothetical protein